MFRMSVNLKAATNVWTVVDPSLEMVAQAPSLPAHLFVYRGQGYPVDNLHSCTYSCVSTRALEEVIRKPRRGPCRGSELGRE